MITKKYLTYRNYVLEYEDFIFMRFFSDEKYVLIGYRGNTARKIDLTDLYFIVDFLQKNNIWNFKKLTFSTIRFVGNEYYYLFDLKTR